MILARRRSALDPQQVSLAHLGDEHSYKQSDNSGVFKKVSAAFCEESITTWNQGYFYMMNPTRTAAQHENAPVAV